MSKNCLHSVLAGLAMFGAVYLVEHVLNGLGLQGNAILLDDILLGIFAAFGLYFLLRHHDTARELRRRQHYALVIAELNHHIRNALQIIVNRADVAIHGLPELDDIFNAVNRIDWALREILPHGDSESDEEPEAALMSGPPSPANRS
jgi:hypothetical protein